MYRGFKSLRFLPLTEIKSKVNIPDTFPGLIVNALLFFPITTLTFVLLSPYLPLPPVQPNLLLELRSLATSPFCRICNLAENKIGNLPLELRSLATEGTQEFPPLKRCRYSHDILSLCDNGSYKLPFSDAAEFGNSAELTLFFHKNSSFCTCRLDTCLAN